MRGSGVLPDHRLEAAWDDGRIRAVGPRLADQIQPSSVDLRLGPVAYRIRASFLPGRDAAVESRLGRLAMHRLDLNAGAVLERGCVYLAPLQESLALPDDWSGAANPKSSTGRIDVFTRLVTDRSHSFDTIAPGYRGPLYAEISPRTFSVLVREGDRLNQLRLRAGGAALVSDADLRARQDRPGEAVVEGAGDIRGGLVLSLDGRGEGAGPVGFRAKRHAGLIELSRIGALDPRDYWEPVEARADGAVLLDPGEFYILASREWVRTPGDLAAEMAPFVAEMGEFRVHYAGFFDPGFGCDEAGGKGSRAVLEVRSRDVPFLLEHGQPVARLVYEGLTDAPARLYGAGGVGSNYQAQGLKLSKHFKAWG